MIVTSVVLPAMIASPTVDIMRGLSLCFTFASVLNVFFVLGGSQEAVVYGARGLVKIGYPGYFGGKNYLGECAALSFLLAFHEMLCPGRRRVLGIIMAAIAFYLVLRSDSKTAFGLAFICPFLAGATLMVRRLTRLSPALILLSIPLCYIVLSSVSNFNMGRLSYMLYGDATFTGRTIIWDFAQSEIAVHPILGWGYQSFWLVPGSPSIALSNWVGGMPNAHNGYYDTMLETGYVGFAFLLAFILGTLHAIGRLADRNPARAQLVLSLALFFILFNFLESIWMRGFEFLWVMFLFLVAEVGRYWQPIPVRNGGLRFRRPKSGNASHLPESQAARLHVGLP